MTMDLAVPAWVVQLGELLEETQRLDAAMAASRAMDLSKNDIIAEALSAVVAGWPVLKGAIEKDSLALTTNQKLIVLDVIRYLRDEFEGALINEE